ncbi:hypothetical protein CERZMDRAFT_80282 [Cercospora zeae-maydis SCOH1-5]|uniref:Mid2 domain-containing protein n=1 Tax=Cercospora zeae-maydis SCOH1-5 TaxID=717836 RepID=A0A6A6FVN7_9PEZI|nr:hypothetical protein CERZMDRAFT_80282 [Cercospora zeae-maydis SCOH1-5]
MRLPLDVAGTLVLLHFLLPLVSAQNCYYPNGDVARTDASCFSDGGACCPLGWECLSNGLCYLENEDYYGRYTCTDRSWGGDCPQYCTSNNTAAGNEAIMPCSDGSWCCDKNRDPTKPDCCDWDDKEEIDVPSFSTVTSITSTPRAPSSVAPFTKGSTSAVEPATTDDPGTSSSSSSSSRGESSITSASQPPTTITTRATSSDSTGGIAIITSVMVSQASSAPTSPSSNDNSDPSGSGDHTGTIIGASIGAVLGILSLLALALFLYRRRKSQNNQRNPPTSDYYPDNHMTFMYNHGKNAHEIDSFPVADVNSDGGGGGVAGGRDRSRPISELTGSNHFMPGAGGASPGSPVSSLGTSTVVNAGNGTSPPTRSPSVGSNGVAGGGWGTSTVPHGPVLPGVQEQPEPQELPPEGNPPKEMGHPGTAVWMGAAPPPPPPKDQHRQPPSWSQPGYGQQQQQQQQQQHAHVPWHPPQGFQLQQQPAQQQQQPGNPEMTEVGPGNSTNGHFTYQAYRPGPAAQNSDAVATTERNNEDDPFATAAPSSSGSGSGRSGASRVSDEDAPRTSSPDPLQPIQGGLRVVNQ